MKFDKIVGFGDSWMYGDELLDNKLLDHMPDAHCSWDQNTEYRENHCFLGLLAQHYNVAFENYGIPGGSLESTEWTWLWWLNHEPKPQSCLVIIFLTEANRASFYNPNHVHYSNDPPWNKFVHSTWVHFGSSVIGPEFTDMIKKYLVLTECEDLWNLRYQRTVLLFDSYARQNKISTLMWNTMPPYKNYPELKSLIWPDFAWTMYFRNHPGNQKRELVKPGGHPNEQGHRIIRDLLIPAIDNAIITE